MEELWDDYLNYLIWRGHLERMDLYSRLFSELHNIEFRWIIDRDGNRAADGVELRDDYEIPDAYCGIIDYFLDRSCSVLEMLIGLAIRVDNDIIGDPAEEHPEKFFMEMIENLGLDRYTNLRFDDVAIHRRIDRWMERKFTSHGLGGLFPVYHDQRDQRDLEIWDQMNSYLNENYN